MSKKIVRKITSIILVVSMALTSITFTDVYAQDQDSYKNTIQIDGTSYDIRAKDTLEGRKVEVIYNDKKYEYVISDDKLTAKEYEVSGKKLFGEKRNIKKLIQKHIH